MPLTKAVFIVVAFYFPMFKVFIALNHSESPAKDYFNSLPEKETCSFSSVLSLKLFFIPAMNLFLSLNKYYDPLKQVQYSIILLQNTLTSLHRHSMQHSQLIYIPAIKSNIAAKAFHIAAAYFKIIAKTIFSDKTTIS